MLSAFPSEVSRRLDEVTVHIGGRDWWPQLHIFDQIILRNFVEAAVNAQRLNFIEKQMSINVFHMISALKSTSLVLVNYLSYTQDGVVNI